jgi:hypothetical protein
MASLIAAFKKIALSYLNKNQCHAHLHSVAKFISSTKPDGIFTLDFRQGLNTL